MIAAGVLVTVAVAVGGYFYLSRRSGAAIDSVAVLPFENGTGDPESDYLADGLTESIIYRLSQLPNLKVSPRASVFHYKGKESDPLKVGGQLGVAAVLSGRITQHGDQITISTELTDVRNNKLLWGEQYDRKMSELLATQREIANEIGDKLKVRISGEDQRLANKHYTESNEAYQSYLKGRYYWNKRTRDGYSKAIDNFKAAIDSDPSFALAYTGLADCYNILSSYGLSSPNESFPLGKSAAMKALELDPDLAEAHTSMAYEKYQYEWDWAGGEREFKRAIELNPKYPTAHHWYGLELANQGRLDEAFAELKKAAELDPLSLAIIGSTGWTLYESRRYDEALAYFQKALDLDQSFSRAHWGIAEPYELKGNYDKAIAELQRSRQIDDSSSTLALLAASYARAGRKAEAQSILAELNQQRKLKYVDGYRLAEIYAALGDKEQALGLLEDAYKERSSLLIWLKLEPKFDSVRSDPRYTDLLHRIGLQ
jgi:TolB-like protein/Flp pilus assembly protein TadD